MNEKILKLALDAGLLNYVDNETPRRYFVHGFAEVEDVEQFAKLIIQECAEVIDEKISPPSHPMNSIGYKLKEHFGVEE